MLYIGIVAIVNLEREKEHTKGGESDNDDDVDDFDDDNITDNTSHNKTTTLVHLMYLPVTCELDAILIATIVTTATRTTSANIRTRNNAFSSDVLRLHHDWPPSGLIIYREKRCEKQVRR